MLTQRLNNPRSEAYLKVKEHILSNMFPWYWVDSTNYSSIPHEKEYNHVPYLSHIFLRRPDDTENGIPETLSPYTKDVAKILIDVLNYNDIKLNCFLRINANCILPQKEVINTIPHVDHYFEHKNLILYLTNAGGRTIVEDVSFEPNEDDAIIFDGSKMHYLQTPKTQRRVVVVATFI